MLIPITDPDDSRVAEYVGLKSDDVKSSAATTFVAEGRLCVRRLAQSGWGIESMLVQDGRGREAGGWVAESVPIYSMAKSAIQTVTGFPFHRGFLAIGKRPSTGNVDELKTETADHLPIVLASFGVSQRENLGGMLRTATALGIDRVLLDEPSADPFSRRAIRASMATVFKQTFYQFTDPLTQWADLPKRGFRTVAACLDSSATSLDQFVVDDRPIVLAIGNEADGLSSDLRQASSERLRISMRLGVDSLNASVAAAILMHRLVENCQDTRDRAAQTVVLETSMTDSDRPGAG